MELGIRATGLCHCEIYKKSIFYFARLVAKARINAEGQLEVYVISSNPKIENAICSIMPNIEKVIKKKQTN